MSLIFLIHFQTQQDLVAVPDFLNGAMENWGLVMFRRAYLVYDKNYVPVEMKRKITSTIAHELTHQVLLVSQKAEVT